MSNYYKQAKEYASKQRFRMKWVNVFDAWQLPIGVTGKGVSRAASDPDSDFLATWIKVSSLQDMVKQVGDVANAEHISLRLHGATKTRKGSQNHENIYYVSVGGYDTNDTTGQSSLQVGLDGRLVGSAAKLLGKLARVVTIELMDTSNLYELSLINSIAKALPDRIADVHSVYPGVQGVYLDRLERNPVYAAWLAEEKAKEKPIQEASLQTGNLKNHLDALAGKKPAVTANPIVRKTYEVVAGDTLSAIARKVYGNPSKWKVLFDGNRSVIGADPNALRAGMQLTV